MTKAEFGRSTRVDWEQFRVRPDDRPGVAELKLYAFMDTFINEQVPEPEPRLSAMNAFVNGPADPVSKPTNIQVVTTKTRKRGKRK